MMSANQLSSLKSCKPEIWVDWLIRRKQTSVTPRKKNKNAKVTIKLERPDRTTIMPITQPIPKVIARVMKNAAAGVASPRPKGKPHFSIIAIDMPAKPIIEPIDRSNSPAIISTAAPVAMIPYWAIIAMLFFRPKGLNALPSEAIAKATMMIIITTKEPISGRRKIF